MKRIISLILCLVMLTVTVSPLCAFAEETDISAALGKRATLEWPEIYNAGHYPKLIHHKPADNYTCDQNPPGFIWPPINGTGYSAEQRPCDGYDIIIARDAELTDVYKFVENVPYHFYNFPEPFEPGVYYWAVRWKLGNEISKWNEVRRFRIDEDATKVYVPNVTGDELLAMVKSIKHPYYYEPAMIKERIKEVSGAEALKEAEIAMQAIIDNPPEVDTSYEWSMNDGGQLVNGPWTLMVRNEGERLNKLSLVYAATGSKDALRLGLERIDNLTAFKIPEYNSYTDTIIGEMLTYISIGYDTFYNVMGEERKKKCQNVYKKVLQYIKDSTMNQNDGTLNGFIQDPTNSHAMGIGLRMIDSALIFRDDVKETKEIFDFLIPLYINNYHTYNTEDGLYPRGTGYTKWEGATGDALTLLNNLGVIDFWGKPKNKNTIEQWLYTYPVGAVGAWGDGSVEKYDVYERNRLREYYDAYNSPVAKWMLEEGGLGMGTGKIFYPTGTAEAEAPYSYSPSKYFKDAGMVGLHSDLIDQNRVSMTFRSSFWGSNNHAHADQNAFVIDAYGEWLAIDSGQYPYYGSPHHYNYSEMAHAHNTITFNGGVGQTPHDIDASGEIIYFINHPEFDLASGDATLAYRTGGTINAPTTLDRFKRNIIFIRPDTFIVIDDLKAKEGTKASFEFWLQAHNTINLYEDKKGARITNGKAQLDADVIYPNVTGKFLDKYMGPDMVNYPIEATQSAANTPADNQGEQCRVYFATAPVSETKMITVLDPHLKEDKAQYIKRESKTGYVKLSFEDGTIAYVQTGQNKEISADNITFNGDAAVIKAETVMLVNGSLLKKDGKTIYESDVPTSMVYGKRELSISSIKSDATIKLYADIDSMVNKRHESLREVEEGKEALGVLWTKNEEEGYSEFKIYNDNYRFYLNGKPTPGTPRENESLKLTIDGEEQIVPLKGYINHYEQNAGVGAIKDISGSFQIEDNNGVTIASSYGLVNITDRINIVTTGNNPSLKLKRINKSEIERIDEEKEALSECDAYTEGEGFTEKTGGSTVENNPVYEFLSKGTQLQNMQVIGCVTDYIINVPEEGEYEFVLCNVVYNTLTNAELAIKTDKDIVMVSLPVTNDPKMELADNVWGITPADFYAARLKTPVKLKKGKNAVKVIGLGGGNMKLDWMGIIKSDK